MSDSLDLLSLVFVVEWEDGDAEDFRVPQAGLSRDVRVPRDHLLLGRCGCIWAPSSGGLRPVCALKFMGEDK